MPVNTKHHKIAGVWIGDDFKLEWLNEEKTRLSVTYHGEIPSVISPSGELVEDPGQVESPSDREISEAIGKQVIFFDAGDNSNYPESIYHSVE